MIEKFSSWSNNKQTKRNLTTAFDFNTYTKESSYLAQY